MGRGRSVRPAIHAARERHNVVPIAQPAQDAWMKASQAGRRYEESLPVGTAREGQGPLRG